MEFEFGLFADIAVAFAAIASTLGFFGGFVMVIVRPWRRRGRKVLLWLTGVFFAATVIITGNADRDAREAGFVDATDNRLAMETGFTDPNAWTKFKAQEAKRVRKAEQAAAEEEARRLNYGDSNLIRNRSARDCHPCLRYDLLPMPSG